MSDNERPLSSENNDSIPDEQLFPVYREELQIGKETVCTGNTNIKRTTITHRVKVTENIHNLEAIVEIIPIGKYVDIIPQPVDEGDMMIIPVYEEHAEIIKRIYLKEEVRIIKKKTERPFEEQVEVKEQIISVTRNKK